MSSGTKMAKSFTVFFIMTDKLSCSSNAAKQKSQPEPAAACGACTALAETR